MKAHFRHWLMSLGILGVFIVTACLPYTAFAATVSTHNSEKSSPNHPYCDPGYVYDNISINGYPLIQFGPTYRDYNGSGGTATDTFTATTGGTATLTVNASVTVNAGVILEGVSATAGISVSYAVTASVLIKQRFQFQLIRLATLSTVFTT